MACRCCIKARLLLFFLSTRMIPCAEGSNFFSEKRFSCWWLSEPFVAWEQRGNLLPSTDAVVSARIYIPSLPLKEKIPSETRKATTISFPSFTFPIFSSPTKGRTGSKAVYNVYYGCARHPIPKPTPKSGKERINLSFSFVNSRFVQLSYLLHLSLFIHDCMYVCMW